ncbi:hypothetical protein ACS0TY_031930 [Phlomoides rotata]
MQTQQVRKCSKVQVHICIALLASISLMVENELILDDSVERILDVQFQRPMRLLLSWTTHKSSVLVDVNKDLRQL